VKAKSPSRDPRVWQGEEGRGHHTVLHLSHTCFLHGREVFGDVWWFGVLFGEFTA
jgi:hypothetical protein